MAPEPEMNVFGPPADPDREKFPFLFDEEPAAPEESTEEVTETPEQTSAPVTDRAAEALRAIEGTPQEEVVEAREEPATEVQQEVLYAGKYKTPQELEKGYRNSRDQARRAAERAKAYEEAAKTAQLQLQQQQNALNQAVAYIQQLEYMRQNQPQIDEFGQPAQAPAQQQIGVDPRLVPYYVEQSVAEREVALRQQLQAEFEAQREQQAREASIYGFYDKHPEVEPGSPVDADVRETLRAFEEAWGDWEPDPSNPDTLEIAYEATQNPELRRVLELNPQYVDSDEGMELARLQAAWLKGGGQPFTQETSQVPASQVGTQRKPVVERASTAGPAPVSSEPLDPWKEAVIAYREDDPQKGIW